MKSAAENTELAMAEKKFSNGTRLNEIRQILQRNHIMRGVSPEKLRIILEQLGPTYIKIGQIMSLHSDILPEEYCRELMKLNSDVPPMDFSEVKQVIEEAYARPVDDVFASIDEHSLGAASIAQVHRAVLKNGNQVIIKVQRKGVHELMSRDISLLHSAVRKLPVVNSIKNVVDLDMVLDEMWNIAQQEMNFLQEADNMEEFAKNNADVKYVGVPALYREYTTSTVLVMEYVEGYNITDIEGLKEAGYDLDEIGMKLVNNYIRQVMRDGFFHADPHPGNLKIRDGKIIWLDMGMMGRLTDLQREIMIRGVRGIANHDIGMVESAVLDLGDFTTSPDRHLLYEDLRDFLEIYGNANLGSIRLGDALLDVMDIMKRNHIRMPHGLTMLARGLSHMQGDLTVIAPRISMAEIAAARVKEDYLHNFDLRQEIEHKAEKLNISLDKGVELPALINDALKEYLRGEGRANLKLQISGPFAQVLYTVTRNLVIGLGVSALFISSSIICMTNMEPKVFGIPLIGFAGYSIAVGISVILSGRYLWRHHKQKDRRDSAPISH